MDKLEAFFLFKYLQAPKRNLFRFSFVFMILGIVLSVGILSAGLNLFEGYESSLRSLLLDNFAHISVQAAGSGYLDADTALSLQNSLSLQPEIISITPSLQYSLLAQVGDKIRSAQLKAYEMNADLPDAKYIQNGGLELERGEIIIGHYLAEEMDIRPGGELSLLYPQLDRISPLGLISGQRSFKVKSLYRSGYYENDRSIVICRLDDAQDFLYLPGQISKLELRVNKPGKARALATKYQILNSIEQVYIPWELYAGSLLKLVKMEKWLIFIVFAFLVLIAAFNVVSAVSTIVIDKSAEIAVLKTLGAKNRSIKRLFAWQVGLAALIAVFLGQVFGLLLSWLVEKQGIYRLKGEVYFIDTLGYQITPLNLFAVALVSLLLISLCIYVPLKQIDRMQIIALFKEGI